MLIQTKSVFITISRRSKYSRLQKQRQDHAMPQQAPELKQHWRKKAVLFQQAMFVRLGDRQWDQVPRDHVNVVLQQKVHFALFGILKALPVFDPMTNNGNRGISEEKELEIAKECTDIFLQNLMMNGEEDVYVSCIFIIVAGEGHSPIPVLKALTRNERQLFMAMGPLSKELKIFEGWSSFLRGYIPTLQCQLCFPVDGVYSADVNGRVRLTFVDMAADTAGSLTQDAQNADQFNSPRGLFSPILLFRETAEENIKIVLSSGSGALPQTGFHGLDSMTKLQLTVTSDDSDEADRVRQADSLQLSLAFSVAHKGSSKYQIPSMELAGISTLSEVVSMAKTTECRHLSSALLFFRNQLVQPRRITIAICQAEPGKPDSVIPSFLTDERDVQVLPIWHRGFNNVIEGQKVKLEHAGHGVELVENEPRSGQLIKIDDALITHPFKLTSLQACDSERILSACKSLKNPKADKKTLSDNLMKDYRLSSEFKRQGIKKNLDKLAIKLDCHDGFENVNVDGTKIFAKMSSSEVDRLGQTMGDGNIQWNENLVQITMNIASSVKITEPRRFCSVLQFIAQWLKDDEKKAKKGGKKKRQREVARKFNAEALERLAKGDDVSRMELIRKDFDSSLCMWQSWLESNNNSIGFSDDYAAAYHYWKHRKYYNSKELTAHQYFDIICDTLQHRHEHLQRWGISQNGDYVWYEYRNSKSEALVIAFHWIYPTSQKEVVATMYGVKGILSQYNTAIN